jgi:hypothetical protein
MKKDGLKEVLTAFKRYKDLNYCHINKFATPGCAKVTTDTEEVLTLYDLDDDNRECRVTNIVRCKDDDVYIFHIIYDDDKSEYDYAIIGVSDKNHEGIDVSDKSLKDYEMLSAPSSFEYLFMTKRDRNYYLNMTWPKFVASDQNGTFKFRYQNQIDASRAIYSFEWLDGNNRCHIHNIVLSQGDKFELFTSPLDFAFSIQDALLSCPELIDYEEEE